MYSYTTTPVYTYAMYQNITRNIRFSEDWTPTGSSVISTVSGPRVEPRRVGSSIWGSPRKNPNVKLRTQGIIVTIIASGRDIQNAGTFVHLVCWLSQGLQDLMKRPKFQEHEARIVSES